MSVDSATDQLLKSAEFKQLVVRRWRVSLVLTVLLFVVYYGYINSPSGAPDQDYVEFKAAGSAPVGTGTVGAAVYYSDDFFGETGPATYVELNASAPIAEKFTVSGVLGYQDVDYDGDYTTWNLGASYALNDVVGFDLRPVGFEQLAVGFVRAQRLVVGQQEVTGKAILDGDDIADAAEFLDAFEQDDFHRTSPPYFTM